MSSGKCLISLRSIARALALVLSFGCSTGPLPQYYEKDLSRTEVDHMKAQHHFQLITYETPPLLVAMPGSASPGFGKGPLLGGTARIPGKAVGFDEEVHAMMRSWIDDPTVRLRDRFFQLLETAMGLSESSTTAIFAGRYDVEDLGSPAIPEAPMFDFRVAEWGLYFTPSNQQYLFQLVGRARFMRPDMANPRWSGNCVVDGGSETLDVWTSNEGQLLRERFESLIEKCIHELLGKMLKNRDQ